MPAEVRLELHKRLKLYENLNIGDKVNIVGGKNKGKKGIVKSKSDLKNSRYQPNHYSPIYQYDNYFSVYVYIEKEDRCVNTGCNYVRKCRKQK